MKLVQFYSEITQPTMIQDISIAENRPKMPRNMGDKYFGKILLHWQRNLIVKIS